MNDSRIYKLGHTYIDDIANSRKTDQFVNWLSGIGNSKGIRYSRYKKFKNKLPAFVVLITREINHRHHNPWDDIIDLNSSKIFYWGDAKFNETKRYNEYDGNKTLLAAYENYLDGNSESNPPILHFSKKKSGTVTFNGLCIVTNVQTTWFEDMGNPVKNYRFELTILDAEEVNVEWLLKRKMISSLDDINSSQAPNAWKSFLNGRIDKLKIFKTKILNRNDQIPENDSIESEILFSICKFKPIEFEALIVELFRSLPHINHNITRTRLVKDGGFDFYGEFNLPYPFDYKIEFLGEAKRYGITNPIGPDKISRLVARLSRGQYGIFVTTSYYTKQAQEEVLEDKYPIRLYNGLDILNFLRELKLIENGKIKQSWLNEVFQTTCK